ncbi:MAG: hypothetical protein LC795_00445 [Acidobacteria bacterium]|nr:hypothetical protein [Acidobacteriota bacterium]
MPTKLKDDFQIWKLAKDLGLKPKDDPVKEIVHYCLQQVRAFLKEFPCDSLSDLLETSATKLDTKFVEIHSDEELQGVKCEYLNKGETAFALLDEELKPKVYAVTFRRLTAKRGERQFISIIDCRDDKAFRAYFSKWHELAHLLTLTQQMRFKFCRTHATENKNDPEEALMEIIAGEISFLPEFVDRHAQGEISFEKICELRELLCSDASFQSSVIGFTKRWASPCVLVEAGLGYKKSEIRKLEQNAFDFLEKPTAELRVFHANANDSARQAGIFIPQNIRIPKASIIHQVFSGEFVPQGEAVENLSWWEKSDGSSLSDQQVLVKACRNGEHVLALIIPVL